MQSIAHTCGSLHTKIRLLRQLLLQLSITTTSSTIKTCQLRQPRPMQLLCMYTNGGPLKTVLLLRACLLAVLASRRTRPSQERSAIAIQEPAKPGALLWCCKACWVAVTHPKAACTAATDNYLGACCGKQRVEPASQGREDACLIPALRCCMGDRMHNTVPRTNVAHHGHLAIVSIEEPEAAAAAAVAAA